MLTITNGRVTLKVTRGAFENSYRPYGFSVLDGVGAADGGGQVNTQPTLTTQHPGDSSQDKMVESDEGAEEVPDTDETEEEVTEEEDKVDLSEIPLSELDFYQLQDYADQLGLDHAGMRSKKEIRALIRAHLKG